jgi:hypothetical protein
MKEDEMKDRVKLFLEEFMALEYKGREHIIARDHYAELFSSLIPKYFAPLKSDVEGR